MPAPVSSSSSQPSPLQQSYKPPINQQSFNAPMASAPASVSRNVTSQTTPSSCLLQLLRRHLLPWLRWSLPGPLTTRSAPSATTNTTTIIIDRVPWHKRVQSSDAEGNVALARPVFQREQRPRKEACSGFIRSSALIMVLSR